MALVGLTVCSRSLANSKSQAKAPWSVSPQDFQNSDPGKGRSYFDVVFSSQIEGKRVYQIPYPLQKMLKRIQDYLGPLPQTQSQPAQASGLQALLIPMGRSLQRNASQLGSKTFDPDLFFQTPRLVVAVDENPTRAWRLNLKGKLYLGFHEKSKVVEVISYNDQEARFEYQIVRDYEKDKTPQVLYANRKVCLSCHSNHAPIFSVAPWNESNAHSDIAERIEQQLRRKWGNVPCQPNQDLPFCYAQNKTPRYFGLPTKVDINVPSRIDELTQAANYMHAYQKLWQSLCADENCQRLLLKSILLYLLNAKEGVFLLAHEKIELQKMISLAFQKQYPDGLKIPSGKIPNRHPLRELSTLSPEDRLTYVKPELDLKEQMRELLQRSSLSGEQEPLLARPALELWDDLQLDSRNLNKLITGLASFFSETDIQLLQGWLEQKARATKAASQVYEAKCEIAKTEVLEGYDLHYNCQGSSLALESGYLRIRQNKMQSGHLQSLTFFPATQPCERKQIQTTEARLNARACPALLDVTVQGKLEGKKITLQLRNSQFPARLVDGRLVPELTLDLESQRARIFLFEDMQLLQDALNYKWQQTPFDKNAILAVLAKNLSSNLSATVPPEAQTQNLQSLVINVEELGAPMSSTPLQAMNPIEIFQWSCATCHENSAGVPPAFLGLKQDPLESLGKCQRIESCAGRILYRLKMNFCSAEQIASMQKNPMPLPQYFQTANLNMRTWQEQAAPQMIQFASSLLQRPKFIRELVSRGLSMDKAQYVTEQLNRNEKNCPDIDYKTYEFLPRCDFTDLRAVSNCPLLLRSFERK